MNIRRSINCLFFGLLVLMSNSDVFSQKYGTALGIRGGKNGLGLTLQQRIFPQWTIEAMAVFNDSDYRIITLLEIHQPFPVKSLNYYLGPGFHYNGFYDSSIEPLYGADVILGIEWKLPVAPLVISADFKPAVHLNEDKWFDWDSGLSARFILVSDRDLKKRKKRKEKEKKRDQRRKDGKIILKDLLESKDDKE